MKKLFIVIILLILSADPTLSQAYWEKTGEINAGDIHFLVVDSSDFIFAATDSGIFRSTDNRNSWLQKGLKQDIVNSVTFDSIGNIIAGTNDGLFKSTDSGESWSSLGLATLNVLSVALNSSDHIFAGVFESDSSISGVYRSIDGGIDYSRLVDGMDEMRIRSIGIDNNDKVYASTWRTVPNRIYLSTNNGESWNPITISAGFIYDAVWIHPNGYMFHGEYGIWRSTDFGESWDHFAMPVSPNAFKLSDAGIIYCGTAYDGVLNYGGLFISNDTGEDWIGINMSGTPQTYDGRSIRALTINSKDTVFIGTFGGDIYRSIELVSDVNKEKLGISSSFILEQNFPNPFNPTTTIQFSIPENERVTIKLFGMLGNKITTIANKEFPAGKHKVLFNASTIPSGVYVYELTAGQFRDAKKLIILK